MEDRCKYCIWACKRDFDTSMRLCKRTNTEVWGMSMPCPHYERFEGNFYGIRRKDGAVQ